MPGTYYQVRPGNFVHWPEYLSSAARDGSPKPFVPRRDRLWAKPGDIIHVTSPFIGTCLTGQEYKLQKLATPGREAKRVLDAKDYPIAVTRKLEVESREAEGLATPTKEATKVAVEVKAAETELDELPGIDIDDEEPTENEEAEDDA